MNKPFPPPRNGRTQVPRAKFLDAANEAWLARCWRDKGDVAARNRLVSAHHALSLGAAKGGVLCDVAIRCPDVNFICVRQVAQQLLEVRSEVHSDTVATQILDADNHRLVARFDNHLRAVDDIGLGKGKGRLTLRRDGDRAMPESW